MKSLQPKNNSPGSSAHSPFFQKENTNNFFGKSEKPKPFFSSNPIQAKLTIGQPNDIYEKKADATADKVVQRLGENNVQTKPENNSHFFNKNRNGAIQQKSIAPISSITPFVQTKCATCENEEKLQKKEDAEEKDLLRDELQKKPIFESNAEPPIDNLPCFGESKSFVSQQTPKATIQKQDAGTPLHNPVTPALDPATPVPNGGAAALDNLQHPVCYGRTLSQSEIEQRLAIYQDMVRGITNAIPQRDNILNAMCGFSIHQLIQMQEAGVRFWPRGSTPTLPGNITVPMPEPEPGVISRYDPRSRIIELTTISSNEFRHELAHAWDYIKVMPRRSRLDDLSVIEIRQALAIEQTPNSESDRRHPIGQGRRMTIEQMFEAYRVRIRRIHRRPDEQAFGTPGREGYSLRNVREFYAEGYAVFNSTLDIQQARMRIKAPELYEYLRQEAEREHLPVPN